MIGITTGRESLNINSLFFFYIIINKYIHNYNT